MSYYIAHSGTKGMKWGVRKYQNEDGSLTEAGKERYGKTSSKTTAYERELIRQYEMKKNMPASAYEQVKNKHNYSRYSSDKYWTKDQEQTLKNSGGNEVSVTRKYTDGSTSTTYKPEYDMSVDGEESLDDYFKREMKEAEMAAFNEKQKTAMSHIPASALNDKKKADKKAADAKKKADYESRMKSNIPASAWNQRVKELNRK